MHPVPFPSKKHPDDLIAAIITASETGLHATEIQRKLRENHLAGWGRQYTMPLTTVRYYIREHRKEQALKARAVPLDQGLGPALYATATKLYLELNKRLEEAIQGKKPSKDAVPVETLDEIGKALKTLEAFVKLRPAQRATTENEDQAPTDPIITAAALLDSVSDPPQSPEAETKDHGSSKANDTQSVERAKQPTPNDTNEAMQVASDAIVTASNNGDHEDWRQVVS